MAQVASRLMWLSGQEAELIREIRESLKQMKGAEDGCRVMATGISVGPYGWYGGQDWSHDGVGLVAGLNMPADWNDDA